MGTKGWLTIVISVVAILISLGSLYFDWNPPILKPDLALYSSWPENTIPKEYSDVNQENFVTWIFIYNGGEGPCVKLNIGYPNDIFYHSIPQQKQSYKYTDIEDRISENLSSTAVLCESLNSQGCSPGILGPNKVLTIGLNKYIEGTPLPDEFNVEASCSQGASASITIKQYSKK